jgi:predicted Zn-dependent peptidase
VFAGNDQVYVYLSGLQKNFAEGVALFEHLLTNCVADDEALANLIDGDLKSREDSKLNKNLILRAGMRNYGVYGPKNPFNQVLTNDELKAVKSKDLVDRIHGLTSWQHRVLYYGPATLDEVTATLNKEHKTPSTLKPVPALPKFPFVDNTKTTVYFVEYNMVQAEVMWLSKSKPYDPAMEPIVAMYNQYYGGNMSSIVFQTIRESKALAYSTNSRYGTPSRKEDPFLLSAYVGTQADKLHEAMEGMFDLLHTMPKSENLFQTGKEGLLNSMRTERITRTDILFAYESAMKMGQATDVRKSIFDGADRLTLDDVGKFHASMIAPQQYNIMILGSKSKIDLKSLEKYGNVVELSLEQVFGY